MPLTHARCWEVTDRQSELVSYVARNAAINSDLRDGARSHRCLVRCDSAVALLGLRPGRLQLKTIQVLDEDERFLGVRILVHPGLGFGEEDLIFSRDFSAWRRMVFLKWPWLLEQIGA